MKNFITILLFSTSISFLSSCGSEDDHEMDPTTGMTLIASGQVVDSDMVVNLYLPEGKSLQVGYNRISLGLYDAKGELLHNAHMHVVPIMQMMEMSHSAPFEAFEHDHDHDVLQEFGVVFVMPSGDMGSWKLEVELVEFDSDFQGSASIEVLVTNPKFATLKSFSTDEEVSRSFFVSMIQPSAPLVGVNDLEFIVNERVSMMEWPAVEDLTITIEPEMPSMGHGSPNNVNPVINDEGHYVGSVNFTMTGNWVIHVTIKEGEVILAELDFDLTL